MSDLVNRLRRLDDLSGLSLSSLFSAGHFDELLDQLEEAPVGVVGSDEGEALRVDLESEQRARMRRLQNDIRVQLELGALDVARGLLGEARRVGSSLPEFALLTAQVNKASLQSKARSAIDLQLDEARRLAHDDAFLPELRDARAIYQGLLDRIEVVGQHLDSDVLSTELRRVERRIRTEEARMSVVGTNRTLKALKPNLDALRDLEARAARGELEIALEGAELTPIVTVIQELELQVRPKLSRLVGQHYEDAQRQYAQRADPRAALQTLCRQRTAWRYLDDELVDRLEALEHELTAVVARAERVAELVDEVLELLRDEAYEKAARSIEVELVTLDDAPRELVDLLEEARRQWLLPTRRRVRRLCQRITRLGSLDPARIAELLGEAEQLGDSLATKLRGEAGEISALYERVEQHIGFLDCLDDIAVLQTEGRFDDAAQQLEAFAAESPEFVRAARRLGVDIGSRRSTEELLAEARALYREDPRRAILFAREHVGRDRRFATFVDFIVIEEARGASDEAEESGRYAEALDALERARAGLSDREHPHLLSAIEHMRAVVRDGSRVESLMASLGEGDDIDGSLVDELAACEVGRDRLFRARAWFEARAPVAAENISMALGRWRAGEAVDLAKHEGAVTLLERYGASSGGELDGLLDEYALCRGLARAAEALARGEVDEAEQIARQQSTSRYGARVVAFLRVCQAHRCLGEAMRALGDGDLTAARAALDAAPGDDEQVASARLFISRLAPLVAQLTAEGASSGPDDEAGAKEAVDPLVAYARARALIEEQPEHPALVRLLEQLAARRLAITRARLAACDAHDGPGATLTRMDVLTRDYEAAGSMDPLLAEVYARVDAARGADLDALLDWVRSVRLSHETDAATLERMVELLRIAERYSADEAELAGHRAELEVRLDHARRWQADRDEAEALLERACEESSLEHLEAAARIEARHPGATFGVAARLAGWRQCDGLVQRLEGALVGGAYEDASEVLSRLSALARPLGLPHAETLLITHPIHGAFGPGVDAFRLQLDGIVTRRQTERSGLIDRLVQIELDVARQEERRLLVEQRSEEDDGEADAHLLASNIASKAESYLGTMAEIGDDAERLGLARRVAALSGRLDGLRVGVLTSLIDERRSAVQKTMQWLNEMRQLPDEQLALAGTDIDAVRRRYGHSRRIQRFAEALQRRIGGGMKTGGGR